MPSPSAASSPTFLDNKAKPGQVQADRDRAATCALDALLPGAAAFIWAASCFWLFSDAGNYRVEGFPHAANRLQLCHQNSGKLKTTV